MAVAGGAHADGSFYCGEHIIENGMQKAVVAEYCGQPTTEEDGHWIYDRGEEMFLIVVHFDGDEVSDIQQVPRQ